MPHRWHSAIFVTRPTLNGVDRIAQNHSILCRPLEAASTVAIGAASGESGGWEVTNDDEELLALANRLQGLVLEGKLGTRSLWALKQMLESWENKQLNGIVSFRIEPAERGKVEVAFTSNATEVSTRWEFGT